MFRLIAAFLAAAPCASVTQAQTATPPADQQTFSLDRALSLARAVSPSLEAATAGVRAANAARAVAGLRPNPELQATSENVAGSGQYRGVRSAETTVGLALPIELGGKRSARVAVAGAQGDRARIAAAMAQADLQLRVTQAYIAAVASEQRLAITRDQRRIADNAFRAAQIRVRAGAGAPIDEQRADVLRVNAALADRKAARVAEVARDNLARLIGQPVAGVLDAAWFTGVKPHSYGPRLPGASASTLTLAAARADVSTASAQVRLARSQRVPDVTISASARRLAATGDTAAVIGFAVPLPLFNNGAAAVRQAQALQDQTDAERRIVSLDAEQDIATAQADLDNAAASARTAGGPALAAAAEAARIARVGYAQGKFSQLDLLQAEQTLAETRAAYTDALAEYHDAEARLARLTAPALELVQ